MGGSIAVTYKKSPSEVYKMSRWTNPLPFFTTDYDLHVGNIEKFSQNFLKSWLEMKQDYETNKETGKFTYPMTNCYFPFSQTMPDGYGLVVIDVPHQKIMSMQGYSNFGFIGGHNFFSLLNNSSLYEEEEAHEEVENYKNLYDAGFLKNFVLNKFISSGSGQEKKKQSSILNFSSLGITDFNSLVEYSKNVTYENHALWHGYIPILSPWKIERFSESMDGAIQFYNALLEMGYIFSEEENLGWQEYIRGFEPDYNFRPFVIKTLN